MKKFLQRIFIYPLWLYGLSAILLSLSFPKTNFSFLVWIALVPLMLALDGKSRGGSFRLAYFCGILFFGLMLYWFIFVTVLGAGLLVIYFALYFGFFGAGYFWLSRKKFLLRIFLIPALWVTLEYLRAHLLSGFGWVSLGYSQYQNLGLIQIADITGVYGVSFLIVMANVFFKEAFVFFFRRASAVTKKELVIAFVLMVVLTGLSMGYSFFKLCEYVSRDEYIPGANIKIGVVQGNVPHERRWHPKAWPFILRDYVALSEKLMQEKVDLIIWPESAYPGYAGEDPQVTKEFKTFLLKTKTPHMIGMITKDGDNYFNSAVLFSSAQMPGIAYHKIHLVPFGEFIPLRRPFPFLAAVVPIDDFTRGKEYVVFESPSNQASGQRFFYSVLICFEDTVPELVRGFVKNGANLLVNISNDAWFEDTKEPFLHLQSAVFRCIENRRFLVRCGNVGISCFVDTFGRMQKAVINSSGKMTYLEGVASQEISFASGETLYTKFGDFFAYFCISGILVVIIGRTINYRKKRRSL